MTARLRYPLAILLLLVFTALVSVAAPRGGAKQTPFRRQPSIAAKSLKVTATQPFTAGFVFVNGKYIPPPYRVERYGTVIRVNGVQVTDPIVPWDEFLRTQNLREVKVESKCEGEGEVEVESKREGEVKVESKCEGEGESKCEGEVEIEEEGDVANIDDIDDLFESSSAPVVARTVQPRVDPKPAVKTPAPHPKPLSATMEIDGEFVLNEKARALLARINSVRKEIDAQLRKGGYYCFMNDAPWVTGDQTHARRLIEKLPDVMKNCSDADEFLQGAREAGLTYLPSRVLKDFSQNRIDYPMLMERRKAWKGSEQWKKALNSSEMRSY